MANANQSGILKDKPTEFGQNLRPEINRFDKGEENVSEGMSSMLSSAQEKVGELGSKVPKEVLNVADKAKKVASDTYENVGSMIKEHPAQAFFIGLTIGCIAGSAVTAILKR